MVHLEYSIDPQTLQSLPCLLSISYEFRWWSSMFIFPQSHDLAPLYVLASLIFWFIHHPSILLYLPPSLFFPWYDCYFMAWVFIYFSKFDSCVYFCGNLSEGGITSTSDLRGHNLMYRSHLGTHPPR